MYEMYECFAKLKQLIKYPLLLNMFYSVCYMIQSYMLMKTVSWCKGLYPPSCVHNATIHPEMLSFLTWLLSISGLTLNLHVRNHVVYGSCYSLLISSHIPIICTRRLKLPVEPFMVWLPLSHQPYVLLLSVHVLCPSKMELLGVSWISYDTVCPCVFAYTILS